MTSLKGISLTWLVSFVIVSLVQTSGAAPTVPPTFAVTFTDARTDDNQFVGSGGKQRWDIDPGADSYQNEYYERPTIQGFNIDPLTGKYSASQYFANLDIVTARAGRDNQFLYVEINLVGNYFHKEDDTKDFEGLKYQYGFRFSDDPDGRGGYLMYGTFADPNSQAAWTALKTKGSRDTNDDVGGRGLFLGGPTGLNVTKEDNLNEDGGVLDGYDADIINDGKLLSTGAEVLFIRMVGTSTVQFALDYAAIGLNADYVDSIQYLDMEAIKGGPLDPRNYFWNDKYVFNNAGSPYLADFNNGIQPPNDIYELDTIRGGAIPEPVALGLLVMGALGLTRRRK